MKIAFIVSEAVPYIKTGGLADVAGALPSALAASGNEILVLLPLYKEIRERFPRLKLLTGSRPAEPAVFEEQAAGIRVWFIENETWFGRDHVYGTCEGDDPENGDRFAWFSQAALRALRAGGFVPDILHLHDWQTSTAAAYLKFIFAKDPTFRNVRTIFTIHNLAYQGLFEPEILERIGLPPELFRMEDLEFFGRVNFLKAGILYADGVTTVSPRYAREIQTPEFGCGLDGLLRTRSGSVRGILNGIDADAWNPESDTAIAAVYGPDNLGGKNVCKTGLLHEFGLDESKTEGPILGVVSRLAGQKGLDILAEAVDDLIPLGIRIMILGSGEAHIEKLLAEARSRFPLNIGLKLGYDERLARKIFAGSDLFLVPSRYEPCGLTQMYSQRYGAIPVVRAVGGLDDTVEEFSPETGEGTGFKFSAATPVALIGAVKRALASWRDPERRMKLRQNGMTRDFSWKRSAEEYLSLYHEILARRPLRTG